jgi:hypothetical protein
MPDLEPLTVDPALTEPLGQIVIRWASLESWVSFLLANLLDADPGGMHVMTNSVSTSTQTQWIRNLLKHRPPHEAEKKEKIESLLNWADDLRSERNEFIHGLWDTTKCEPGTAIVETVNFQRARIVVSRLVTPNDLNQLVIEIDDWIAAYVKLGRELGFPRRRGESKSVFSD